MNSCELVSAALKGMPVPRVPVGPLAVHFCARVAGRTLREYTTDPSLLADSILRYYERFKPDAVWVSADTWVSAEAMGAVTGATDDDQPFAGMGPPVVSTPADIDRIPRPDVSTQGRYPLLLTALSRVVAALKRHAFIVACFDQYPFSLAAALMGIDRLMIKLVDDPPFVHALLEKCSQYCVAYARALSAAGADMLSGGDSPVSLIGPDFYTKFALPAEQSVIRQLRSSSEKPVSLHICGKALPILPFVVASGADVLELETALDPTRELLGQTTAVWGNLDPVRLLVEGNPGQVQDEVVRVLKQAQQLKGGFVLSSGCTLAVNTPFDNVDAMISAARQPPAGTC